jgi:hypothetical protein
MDQDDARLPFPHPPQLVKRADFVLPPDELVLGAPLGPWIPGVPRGCSRREASATTTVAARRDARHLPMQGPGRRVAGHKGRPAHLQVAAASLIRSCPSASAEHPPNRTTTALFPAEREHAAGPICLAPQQFVDAALRDDPTTTMRAPTGSSPASQERPGKAICARSRCETFANLWRSPAV